MVLCFYVHSRIQPRPAIESIYANNFYCIIIFSSPDSIIYAIYIDIHAYDQAIFTLL